MPRLTFALICSALQLYLAYAEDVEIPLKELSTKLEKGSKSIVSNIGRDSVNFQIGTIKNKVGGKPKKEIPTIASVKLAYTWKNRAYELLVELSKASDAGYRMVGLQLVDMKSSTEFSEDQETAVAEAVVNKANAT